MDFTCMEPDFGSHKDFRSSSVPKKQRRTETTKYYSYRAVHPSWVGREYYDIQLVSSTAHTVRQKPKPRRYPHSPFHVTHITENEEPVLLNTLIESGTKWNCFHKYWLPPEIHLAVAQAKAADVSSYPIVIPETPLKPSTTNTSFDNEDPHNPHSIERVAIDPPDRLPRTMPDNLTLKLRVKTWTKQDNYATKTHSMWGPDRRHHHGKRRVREKHLQKWEEKQLGRGQKQKGKLLEDEIMGFPRHPWYRVWLGAMFKEYREDLYDNWDSNSSYCNDTIYWNWDDDFLGSNWRDIEGNAWEEDEYYGDHWSQRIDEVALLWKVLDWRELGCDYEAMDGYEDDTVSVGSDVVILEQIVDIETNADVDVMSDLAEVIVQEEWDVLSETSSVSEAFVATE